MPSARQMRLLMALRRKRRMQQPRMSLLYGMPNSERAVLFRQMRTLREQGLQQRDIADRLNVSQATVSRWLNGAHQRKRTRD